MRDALLHAQFIVTRRFIDGFFLGRVVLTPRPEGIFKQVIG
jgi:hypothetical protein